MWQLQGDEDAAKAFVGEDAEILMNGLYQNQKICLEERFEVPRAKRQVATGCITIVQIIPMLIVGLLVEEGI